MSSPRTLALACLILLLAAPLATRAGGPPMVSVETLDGSTDGPAFRVRALRCGQPLPAQIVGTAEGLVNGVRRTVPLELVASSDPGSYALSQQWPTQGRWLLVFTIASGRPVSTVVTLATASEPGAHDAEVAQTRVLQRRATERDIRPLLVSPERTGQ